MNSSARSDCETRFEKNPSVRMSQKFLEVIFHSIWLVEKGQIDKNALLEIEKTRKEYFAIAFPCFTVDEFFVSFKQFMVEIEKRKKRTFENLQFMSIARKQLLDYFRKKCETLKKDECEKILTNIRKIATTMAEIKVELRYYNRFLSLFKRSWVTRYIGKIPPLSFVNFLKSANFF